MALETTLTGQVRQLADALHWAETIWLEDDEFRKEVDEKQWLEFIEFLRRHHFLLKLKKSWHDMTTPPPPVEYDPAAAEEALKARESRLTILEEKQP